ncbi:hypothetical protein K439DRAFT_1637529 [Ramaria rubella]|nr:hypothetical protein K439DRAFT_1637529 [Ramaria rubella]
MSEGKTDLLSARKRARTDDVLPDGPLKWKRHPELYMSDGTLVLLADDTLFRVYPGLMSRHSEVFSGMTSLSEYQPSNPEMYDGFPLVRLTDNNEDLGYFLEATMGAIHFHTNQPTAFKIAAALLRLSTKYMVSPLRQQAVEHFRRIIPKNMDDIGHTPNFKQVFGTDTPHPFELVTLFRECQITAFLPWAFYIACKEGFKALVCGAPSAQGETIYLSPEDNRVALLGWKSLDDENSKSRLKAIKSWAENCTEGFCNNVMRAAWVETSLHNCSSDALVLWGMFKLLANSEDLDGVQENRPCQFCAALWLKTAGDRRRRVWAGLPATFQLPPWEELQQD